MHVKVLGEEALCAVTSNITLKLQSLFKKGRVKEKMSAGGGEEVEEKGGICLLLFGKRISFVSVFIPTSLTGPADVHENLPLMLT